MKMKPPAFVLMVILTAGLQPLWPGQGLIDRFEFSPDALTLSRPARPQAYFDKAGRKFAILASESGSFEAWAYPLKILRNCEFSFLLGSSTTPLLGRDIARRIEVSPAVTTVTYTFQSFTVKASFVTSVDDPGAVILLEVDAVEPLTVVCGFLPVLQPMWPAGIGGQYAYWDSELKAYLISEPRRQNHGFIGSPAAEGISYTPAHMLSDAPNEFKITIADPKAVRDKLIPIILAGGKGDREAVKAVYRKLLGNPQTVCRQAEEHFRLLRAGTLRISTPDPDLDRAFEWAKVAYDTLLVDHPDLGLGLVAGLGPSGTGGRPGFGWFFGTDACFNALSLTSAGAFRSTRAALSFLTKRQRSDGKMMHELSQAAGYVDWFKDYPYGYIHADTSPYFIVAAEDYAVRSGDSAFIKENWTTILKAFEYCLGTDANGDGLMDNRRAGLGALEFGALTDIETDVYLGAVWVQACRAMERLSELAGDAAAKAKAASSYHQASRAFEEKFWDEASGHYSYGFSADGRRVAEITPWSAVGPLWGLGAMDRARRTLERLNRADVLTDWGIRMMPDSSPYYEPLNYNYGACWPFLAGYVAAALYEHDMALQGWALLRSTMRHTFDNGLGTITELYSGHQNIWPGEAVPHQGFSSGGVVLPLVRGLLGLDGDALERSVVFHPRLPGDWPTLRVENFKAGPQSLSLELERSPARLRLKVTGSMEAGWTMTFSPVLAGCSGLGRVRVNGIEFPAKASTAAYPFRPTIRFALSGTDVVEMDLVPALDWLAPDACSNTGDTNHGLKIVSVRREGKTLRAVVEGLAGRTYKLALMNPGLAVSAEGGVLESGRLTIVFPEGEPERFLSREVSVTEK
ncbi:MAG: hypothetical protein A2Y56_07740 [Candidatus Aminicenantes bacterium RBG_13_63_10]|nr:MAG: hypothetical protein A2Y56_07740 [Candidatus Aminicenantes bacterium RBG_13_63_10]